MKQWRKSQNTVSSLFLCQCPNREALEEGSSSIPVGFPRDALTVVSPSSPAALGVTLLKPVCTPLTPKGDLLLMSSLKGEVVSLQQAGWSAESLSLFGPCLNCSSLPFPLPQGSPWVEVRFLLKQCGSEELSSCVFPTGSAEASLGLHPCCTSSSISLFPSWILTSYKYVVTLNPGSVSFGFQITPSMSMPLSGL